MTFTDAQIDILRAPLNAATVKKNPRGFDYIEAWHAIAEANRIFGFDAWNRQTVEMRQLGEPRLTGDNWRVGYFAKVRVTVGEIVREGCGFGQGINKDVDLAHEGALKEAESDAMKRALMTFGNPFGLALYDKAKANVETVKPPSLASRKPEFEKLERGIDACKSLDDLTDWGGANAQAISELPDIWKDGLRDRYAARRVELTGAANVAEAEAELDAGFRGATGGGRTESVAGRDGQRAA